VSRRPPLERELEKENYRRTVRIDKAQQMVTIGACRAALDSFLRPAPA